MMAPERLVSTWPTVVHICTRETTGSVQFRGACREGQEVICPHCQTVFRYTKPRIGRVETQRSGPRSHF